MTNNMGCFREVSNCPNGSLREVRCCANRCCRPRRSCRRRCCGNDGGLASLFLLGLLFF